MTFKTSDNFELAFDLTDSGIGKNVLFIHGNLACRDWWTPSLELMKAAQPSPSKLVAYDWRGYGDSKGLTSKSQIDFERYATDALELCENLNLADIHVVGHSTGGLIAMMAILQKPQLFSSLTLLDSVGATGLELQLPREQVLGHFEKLSIDRDYCAMVLAATIEGVDATSSSFQALAQKAFKADTVNFTGVVETLVDSIDITARMGELKLPTLILHGEKDLVLPLAGSETLQQQIAGSQLVVLDGQGHSCNMENPQRFAGLLKDFISQH